MAPALVLCPLVSVYLISENIHKPGSKSDGSVNRQFTPDHTGHFTERNFLCEAEAGVVC